MPTLWMTDDRQPVDVRLDDFAADGYVVLPGLLPPDLVRRLRPEVDRWVDGGLRAASIASCLDPELGRPPVLEVELPAHGELLVQPGLTTILRELLGPSFVFHHLHSDRQDPGIAGKSWHHDHETQTGGRPDLMMVHALHYLDGLDESISSLAVLPGSHREPSAKTARAHLGTGEIPGEVVIERLPAGSTVLLHSALFHARRPREHAGPGRPRYMVDASYCQTGGRWRPVKPYWREVLRSGRELGIGADHWPELFAEQHFGEYVDPRADSR